MGTPSLWRRAQRLSARGSQAFCAVEQMLKHNASQGRILFRSEVEPHTTTERISAFLQASCNTIKSPFMRIGMLTAMWIPVSILLLPKLDVFLFPGGGVGEVDLRREAGGGGYAKHATMATTLTS